MIFYIFLFILGLVLVLRGGNYFVDSSVSIARQLKIPRIVIGGTIVSLATTAPEFVVSTTASYMGDSGIALGNALGSAIANIGLIVSISAILAPIVIDVADFRRRALWMLVSAALVFLFSWDLEISRQGGIILLILATLYLSLNTLRAVFERKQKKTPDENSSSEESISIGKLILMFLFGVGLVIIGSKLLVNSSIEIAKALKIPSIIIGMTVVAVGTSLPELVTAITSAKKKVADLAIGNIVGANILNLSLITGTSAIINPLSLNLIDRYYAFSWLFIMIIAMVIIFWKKGEMQKKAGSIMLSLYVIYNLGLILFSELF
jgi:cation:H+ antiporter